MVFNYFQILEWYVSSEDVQLFECLYIHLDGHCRSLYSLKPSFFLLHCNGLLLFVEHFIMRSVRYSIALVNCVYCVCATNMCMRRKCVVHVQLNPIRLPLCAYRIHARTHTNASSDYC